MKQVTIDTVRERIAELEKAERISMISIRAEFELACLRMLVASMDVKPFMYGIADPDGAAHMDECCVSTSMAGIEDYVHMLNEECEEGGPLFTVFPLYTAPPVQVTSVDDDVRSVVSLLENNEWAEHCTKTELGQRLESEITRLVGSVQPVPVADPEDEQCKPHPVMSVKGELGFLDHFDRIISERDEDIDIGQLGSANYDALMLAALDAFRAAMHHGAEPSPATDNTAQQFEALAGINANKHNYQWVNCSERLPDRFRHVLVMLSDGSQRVGRINYKDTWLIASYLQTKHQYTGEVVMWFDTPNPTSAGSGKL